MTISQALDDIRAAYFRYLDGNFEDAVPSDTFDRFIKQDSVSDALEDLTDDEVDTTLTQAEQLVDEWEADWESGF